jgi:prepilin-type N-terminal cleavage/methylation domain-containing protein
MLIDDMKTIRHQHQKKKAGFTLVELLLVIIILGVLIVAGLSSFTSSQKKARDVKRKNDLRQVALALETYYNDKGRYPAGDTDGQILGCGSGVACPWGEAFQDENATVYMLNLPVDGMPNMRYFYIADPAGSWYQLYARLDNKLDNDLPKDTQDPNKSRVFTDLTCDDADSVYCNYGVASSNKSIGDSHTVAYE